MSQEYIIGKHQYATGYFLVLCGELILITGQSIKKYNYVPEKERFVEVQCSGRKYTKFPLASTLPENTSIISFMDNKIQQLPSQPPQELRDKVWNINLSGNIIVIGGQTWKNIPKCFKS